MEIEGRVWKDGNAWLIEFPALNVMTQGKTKKEALMMGGDAVEELLLSYFKTEVDVQVKEYADGVCGLTSGDNSILLAFSLRRQREISGSTVREVSERLGSDSPNAYAQYEKAKKRISLDKYEQLLIAVNPAQARHVRIV